MKTAVVSMVRNEADIIDYFLTHCVNVFDDVYIADVQSTDGTKEIIETYGKSIHVLEMNVKEKIQGPLMTYMVRLAVGEGADWVFCLDADEFISISSRNELHQYLLSFVSPVMALPWVNLIPSKYSDDFKSFDIRQDFFWNGRFHSLHKIAVSKQIVLDDANFRIDEGNHHCIRNGKIQLNDEVRGIPVLHLPIRSRTRLTYKIDNAHSSLMAKKSRVLGEGVHIIAMKTLIEKNVVSYLELNYLTEHYSDGSIEIKQLNPKFWNYPVIRLPSHSLYKNSLFALKKNFIETDELDKLLLWEKLSVNNNIFVKVVSKDRQIIFERLDSWQLVRLSLKMFSFRKFLSYSYITFVRSFFIFNQFYHRLIFPFKSIHAYWIIKRSGLFDSDYYLNSNKDVREKGGDPLFHYVVHGAKEGRLPSKNFDLTAYYEINQDAYLSKTNPLVHFLKIGKTRRYRD